MAHRGTQHDTLTSVQMDTVFTEFRAEDNLKAVVRGLVNDTNIKRIFKEIVEMIKEDPDDFKTIEPWWHAGIHHFEGEDDYDQYLVTYPAADVPRGTVEKIAYAVQTVQDYAAEANLTDRLLSDREAWRVFGMLMHISGFIRQSGVPDGPPEFQKCRIFLGEFWKMCSNQPGFNLRIWPTDRGSRRVVHAGEPDWEVWAWWNGFEERACQVRVRY